MCKESTTYPMGNYNMYVDILATLTSTMFRQRYYSHRQLQRYNRSIVRIHNYDVKIEVFYT